MGSWLLEKMYEGGATMWLLAMLALVGTVLLVDRAVRLRLALRRSRRDLAGLDDLTLGPDSERRSPAGRMIVAGLRHAEATPALFAAVLEREGRRQVRALGRGLPWIRTLGVVAMFVGFLGTVASIGLTAAYASFWAQASGGADAVVAATIAESLVCSATGLLVAAWLSSGSRLLWSWQRQTVLVVECTAARLLSLATHVPQVRETSG